MSSTRQPSFGRLRSLFWPIQSEEVRLIIPMVLMAFLICMNYTMLRNMKDALVVTANAGAEVLPFIKVWAMFPIAVLLTFIFTKLCNRYSQERVFYITISGFLSFYALFLFVLYPLRETLHPHAFTEWLAQVLPVGCKGFVDMLRNWTFTLFYVMCELWSVMILTVLFWGLANEITKVGDSRRFYAVFNIGSNLGSMVAGQLPRLMQGASQEDAVYLLLCIVFASGLITMLLFRWINRKVLTGPQFDAIHTTRIAQRAKKEKLGMWESCLYVARSPYLLCIAIVVVGYNLVVHITEVLWKDALQHLYPEFNDYNVYLGELTTTIAVVSMCIALCIPKLLEKVGWTATALITPISMSVTCTCFLLLLLFRGSPDVLSMFFFGASPLAILVVTGAMQNITCRACKYSVFDATKEMAFIPLDHEYKLKGKAAIDGVGSRLGKSGGSFLLLGLMLSCGSLAASIPYLGILLAAVLGLWIYSVGVLGKKFHALTQKTGVDLPEVEQSEESASEQRREISKVASKELEPAL